jgi:lactoylglutathione lyase
MVASLKFVIRYVSDVDKATRFYVENFGMSVRFQSPHWTELETGETTLALHPASDSKPAGSSELGLVSFDLDALYERCTQAGAKGIQPPGRLHGVLMAKILGPDGEEITLSSPN